MSESIERTIITEAKIDNDREKWRKNWLQNAERITKEYQADYEAQVQAGLIDPEKIKKYYEIRREHWEKLHEQRFLEQDSLDLEKVALQLQQKLDHHRFWWAAQGTSAYAYFTGCEVDSTSYPPPQLIKCGAGGECIATNEHLKGFAGLFVNLSLRTKSSNCSHACVPSAEGWGKFNYVIPGSILHYGGWVEVYPYIMLLGEVSGEVSKFSRQGKLLVQGKVSTEIYQQEKLKESSTGNLFSYEISETVKSQGSWLIQISRNPYSLKAHNIASGIDVEIKVKISFESRSWGCDAWSNLDFYSLYNNRFISVPHVDVEYTPYPPPVSLNDGNRFPPPFEPKADSSDTFPPDKIGKKQNP